MLALSITGNVAWYMLILAGFVLGIGVAAGMWLVNHILK